MSDHDAPKPRTRPAFSLRGVSAVYIMTAAIVLYITIVLVWLLFF